MNILIVDDQPNIISSLVRNIQWRDLGITEVYTATSALSARRILETRKVHILLTDIEMPVESGISLLSWVRQKGIALECIFLTSHTDFYFAQQAIGLDAVDYVVQPARNEDILRALENAKIRFLQKRKTEEVLNTNKFASASQNAVTRRFFEEWPDISEAPGGLAQKLCQLQDMGIDCDKVQPITIIYTNITRWNRMPQRAMDLLPQYQTILCSVLAYLQNDPITWYRKDDSYATILFHNTSDELSEHIYLFQSLVHEKLGCRLNICLCSTTASYVGQAIEHTAGYIKQRIISGHSGSNENFLDSICYMPEPPKEPEYHASESQTRYFTQIKEYIRENISRPITRVEIADALHISPDYVTLIIKNCTGMTCKELVNAEKMASAKKLIETTTLPIGEIAQRLGYDSFAYFSKVYKATYHSTPRSSRQN